MCRGISLNKKLKCMRISSFFSVFFVVPPFLATQRIVLAVEIIGYLGYELDFQIGHDDSKPVSRLLCLFLNLMT